MKLEITVPEVIDIFKEIQQQPEVLFEKIRDDVKQSVGQYLSHLIDTELTRFLGRKRYQRGQKGKTNYRNGSYHRKFTMKQVGTIDLDVPRDREGQFKSRVIPRSQRFESDLAQDLSLMFLTGVSTRTLSMISKRLIGRKISPAEISCANNTLIEAVEKWRNRDLSLEPIKYMFVDGVCFDMRIVKRIESTPVLVAIGVTESGHKVVLGLQSGDKESASSWRQFFKDLKARGLKSDHIVLGIMDGLPGLDKVFKEEFSNAKTQRCQVHVARNVLAKVTRKNKKQVADDLRSIFYASCRKKADEFFEAFKRKWEKDFPSAVKCLENSIDSCLTFFHFPDEEWISLRTTNIIERLNKEFKRRTKPMEIVAGEQACYNLLAFICIKMELKWRSTPIGKVHNNLPFFKNMAVDKFTQLN